MTRGQSPCHTDPSGSIDYKSEPKEEELGDTIRLMQYI